MSFLQIVTANVLSISITVLFLLWMSGILLGRIPGRGMRHIIICILSALFLVVLLSFLGAVCFRTGFWRLPCGIGRLAWQYFVIACWALLLHLAYRVSFRDSFLSVMMIEILGSYGDLLSELYLYGRIFDLRVASELRQYLFWMFGIRPGCLLLCGLVIVKSGMGKIYRQWLEQEKIHRGILVLLGLYPVYCEAIDHVVKDPGKNRAYLLLPLILLLVIHMIFVYVVRDCQQKQYILAQEANLRQQTIYIEKMEQIQAEIRRFRHDFKNMTAGMYLQAEEGDMKAVQSFIREMTEDFDRQAGDQIRLLNQLANVHMAEIKGLLLEKLALMQKEDIYCELEVLRPFEGTRMRSTDLCRCLGILMDNAADEVRGKENAKIHLMISSQDGCTTFRIKNTLYNTADFQKIGTAGYTTKGEGRGIGLESYRKLLEKYDFVFPFTAIQDGYFVQELKIQEV